MTNIISFSEQRLPKEFSIGASGGPEYSTNVLIMSNGAEQRNVNWRHARANYNLYPAIKNAKMLEELITFFRMHRGKAIGFRFKDWTDYSARKEFIAKADGVTNQFQLIKTYGDENLCDVRIIKKPVEGSVKVYVNNRLVDFECDFSTGLITLAHVPKQDAIITSSFEFDIPVRFDTDFLDMNLEIMAQRILSVPVVEIIQ